jgi:predicted MPP superfamily phosphohydrolase
MEYVVLFFLGLLVYAFLIEPFLLSVERLDLLFDDLPDEFDGFKIVQVSDFHLSHFTSFHVKILSAIDTERPDMIAITGDFNGKNLAAICKDFCKSIAGKSRYVFAVLGNWDHKAENLDFFVKSIKDSGISVLINESAVIKKNGKELFIAGTDDSFTGNEDLGKTFKNIPENNFVIMLTHCPDIIYHAAKYKPQLVLSGHTHGGQVKVPFVRAVYVPSEFGTRFLSGLFRVEGTYLYVNRGIGTSHIPVRFLSLPELTVITLWKKKLAR